MDETISLITGVTPQRNRCRSIREIDGKFFSNAVAEICTFELADKLSEFTFKSDARQRKTAPCVISGKPSQTARSFSGRIKLTMIRCGYGDGVRALFFSFSRQR